MPRDPVFNDNGRYRGLGILIEQHIVPDTESDNNIHVGLGPVKKFGLRNRITGRFKSVRPDFA